jgi:phage protein D
MTQVRQPKFKILYNQKDITKDVTPYLCSIEYKDATEGKSDEIDIDFSNASGKWSDEWYPTFGDQLTVTMGYDDIQFPCGTFDLDEFELTGPPDRLKFKGLAAGITQAIRTKQSDSHENKTLRQIAQKICDRNGFALAGNISIGQIRRVTQNRETDLEFLYRISCEYGYVFSIRDKVMTFTDVYQLEAREPVVELDYSDLSSWSIRDTSVETYKKANVSYHDPKSKKVFETEFEKIVHENKDGYKWDDIIKKDTIAIKAIFDSIAQGQQKAIAALHSTNSKQTIGKVKIPGNPLMVSGNNFTLTGMGKLSGVYHIYKSRHSLSVESGYTTEIDIKRVGFVTIIKTKRKKEKKVKHVDIRISH